MTSWLVGLRERMYFANNVIIFRFRPTEFQKVLNNHRFPLSLHRALLNIFLFTHQQLHLLLNLEKFSFTLEHT